MSAAPAIWVVHDMRRRSKRLERFTSPLARRLQKVGIDDVLVVNLSRADEIEEARAVLPHAVIAIGRKSLFELPAARQLLNEFLSRQRAEHIWIVQWLNDFTDDEIPKPLRDQVYPELGQLPVYSWIPGERKIDGFVSWLADHVAAELVGGPLTVTEPRRPGLTPDELLDLCYGLVARGQCDPTLLTEFRAETLRNGLRHYGSGTQIDQAHRARERLGTGHLERGDPVWLAWVRHMKMDLVDELASRLDQAE